MTIIDDFAFYDCDNLREVTLGKSVREVKRESFGAFGDRTRLSRICCYAQVPPFFVNGYSRATLYVPRESLELYKQVWGTERSVYVSNG